MGHFRRHGSEVVSSKARKQPPFTTRAASLRTSLWMRVFVTAFLCINVAQFLRIVNSNSKTAASGEAAVSLSKKHFSTDCQRSKEPQSQANRRRRRTEVRSSFGLRRKSKRLAKQAFCQRKCEISVSKKIRKKQKTPNRQLAF